MASQGQITRLQQERARHIRLRDLALKAGRKREAKIHQQAIDRLNKALAKVTPASLKRQRPASLRRERPAPKGINDPRAGTPITAANAVAMYRYYDQRVKSTPILTRARAHFERRRAEARRLMSGKGGVAKANKAAVLARMIAEQKRMAAQKRAQKRYAEAARIEHTAQGLERQLRAAEMEAQMGPPPGAPPRHVRMPPPAGMPATVPNEDTPSTEDASEDAAADAALAEDEEAPWYKRYALALGAAAVLGVGAALMYGRKGRSGSRMFVVPSNGGGRRRRATFRSSAKPAA